MSIVAVRRAGIVISSPRAFARFAEALRARAAIGTLAVIVLDRHWRLVKLAPYYDLDHRGRWIEALDDVEPGARVVLASLRAGRGRVARPSDELRWEQWDDLTKSRGITLVDWWVLTEPDFAYSVARFAKRPAAWVC